MLRSMLFQRSGGDRSFIPGYYSRQRTEDGRVQDGRRGGLTNEERKKENVTVNVTDWIDWIDWIDWMDWIDWIYWIYWID